LRICYQTMITSIITITEKRKSKKKTKRKNNITHHNITQKKNKGNISKIKS